MSGQAVRILALGGDGIGPEILECGLRVAHAAAQRVGLDLHVDFDLLHGASYEQYGTFCRPDVLAKARASRAVLVGAVGGPQWDDIRMEGGPEMQDGLMYLRHHLQTFLGLRPARTWPALADQSPLRPELGRGADVLILREMCGGAMFATERGRHMTERGVEGYDRTAYSAQEVERFARGGFTLARQRRRRLVSCDKSNVMESYKLWRDVVTAVAAEFPDVAFENMFADNCAFQLIQQPTAFDVVLCCNQLGDLFSDMTGVLAGSLGLLPSACLADDPAKGPVFGLYESTSGSAPDIAGQGIANPVGMILSVGLMFEYTFSRPELNQQIVQAVETALDAGVRTPDIGGSASSDALTSAILEALGP